ncbi:MAG: Ig-like domain-containing protein, partial [Clostridia bacterium]|nr:Ig-like domain-containing protein [Clostridia bacterium]
VPVALSDVVFTSDNDSIASVDANGVVTLHKAGSTKLRAVYELLGIRAEAEIPVLAE